MSQSTAPTSPEMITLTAFDVQSPNSVEIDEPFPRTEPIVSAEDTPVTVVESPQATPQSEAREVAIVPPVVEQEAEESDMNESINTPVTGSATPRFYEDAITDAVPEPTQDHAVVSQPVDETPAAPDTVLAATDENDEQDTSKAHTAHNIKRARDSAAQDTQQAVEDTTVPSSQPHETALSQPKCARTEPQQEAAVAESKTPINLDCAAVVSQEASAEHEGSAVPTGRASSSSANDAGTPTPPPAETRSPTAKTAEQSQPESGEVPQA